MRTTLTLTDDIARALKSIAYKTGRPFKDVVNDTLRTGLAAKRNPKKARAYKLTPASMGGVAPGINLDKALQLADALEDEEIARKLQLRK